MKLEDLRIVVDEREKKSGIPDLLRSIGMRTEVVTLPVGDYIVGPETVVERKSVRDLVSSIFDGRLFDQCDRLREHFAHPVIVMEGDVGGIEGMLENPMVFYGAVSTAALEFRIPVIPTPSASHTAKLLVSMCSKKYADRGPFIKKIKKSADLRRQQLSLLASLPGVGEKLADRMLEKFGTPMGALESATSDLAKVAGLGSERAKKIRRVLDTKKRRKKRSGQQKLD